MSIFRACKGCQGCPDIWNCPECPLIGELSGGYGAGRRDGGRDGGRGGGGHGAGRRDGRGGGRGSRSSGRAGDGRDKSKIECMYGEGCRYKDSCKYMHPTPQYTLEEQESFRVQEDLDIILANMGATRSIPISQLSSLRDTGQMTTLFRGKGGVAQHDWAVKNKKYCVCCGIVH